MRILFISSVGPQLHGAVSRLLYDILSACPYGNKVDFAVEGKDYLEVKIPSGISFIPWSSICCHSASNNKIFSNLITKREWKHYRDIHIKCDEYNIVIAFPYQVAAFDYVNFE